MSQDEPTTNAQPKPQAPINWPWLPGEYPASWPVVLSELSLQVVREIVREEVQKAMIEMIQKIKAQTGARF